MNNGTKKREEDETNVLERDGATKKKKLKHIRSRKKKLIDIYRAISTYIRI